MKRKQAKKAKEPEDESDPNSSSDEDNDEVIFSQPKSLLSQTKRKAKKGILTVVSTFKFLCE